MRKFATELISIGFILTVFLTNILTFFAAKSLSPETVKDISASFGSMDGSDSEPVDLPPFISKHEIVRSFESFNDRDKIGHSSISAEYLFYFSIMIGQSDYRVYLDKNSHLANEMQNREAARKIRDLLKFSKGKDWFDNKFDAN